MTILTFLYLGSDFYIVEISYGNDGKERLIVERSSLHALKIDGSQHREEIKFSEIPEGD